MGKFLWRTLLWTRPRQRQKRPNAKSNKNAGADRVPRLVRPLEIMTHQEIRESINKVVAYAKELGLRPDKIYWNYDDPEVGVCDPEDMVEDVGDKARVSPGICFRDTYFVERKWTDDEQENHEVVYSSNDSAVAAALKDTD